MFFPTHHEAESSVSLESLRPCLQLTFSEIELATQNFDDSLVIGRGGFGKVYKGTITYGATELYVAIKRLDSTSKQGASEFWAEVKMLSKLRHCHLVSLVGYCNDGQEMILVYEYMPRGTLEDHLHKRISSLTWVRLLKIWIGAARGLDYLHIGTGTNHGVIHRDVKSSNILLDECWAAKISDFGLSKIGPINQSDTHVNTSVKGTFGYLDPDYYSTSSLTRKSDVYAFGVILFEVLCGKRAVFTSPNGEQSGLAGWAKNSIKEGRLEQIVDFKIKRAISPKCLRKFAQLANKCLDGHPKLRPTMAEIVIGLESVLALQEKINSRLHPGVRTLFGRKVPMFRFPSNGENSVGGRSLNSLELPFAAVGGESRMLHQFAFKTLSVATGNFSDANRTLGAIYCMYKGRLPNGQQIAISRRYSYHGSLECIREVKLWVKLEHENLAELLGYCIRETDVFFVYDCAPYANLGGLIFDADHMRTRLDWSKHYKRITLGVARVLLYLQKKNVPYPIVRRAVNPQNIYLDENKNPKLLGFARCLAINEADPIDTDLLDGVARYIAPEYARYGRLSTNVFGFGVLVLEIVSGHPMFGHIPPIHYSTMRHVWKNWLQGTLSRILHPTIEFSPTSKRFIHVGLLCVQEDANARPTMEEVIGMLRGASPLPLPIPQKPAYMVHEQSDHTNAPFNDNGSSNTNAPCDGYDYDYAAGGSSC